MLLCLPWLSSLKIFFPKIFLILLCLPWHSSLKIWSSGNSFFRNIFNFTKFNINSWWEHIHSWMTKSRHREVTAQTQFLLNRIGFTLQYNPFTLGFHQHHQLYALLLIVEGFLFTSGSNLVVSVIWDPHSGRRARSQRIQDSNWRWITHFHHRK